MNKSVLLLTVAAFTFGANFSAQAEDVQVASNLTPVATVVPVAAGQIDCRYVQCDYNFLGRILIRDGKFYLGLQGEFVQGEGLQITSVEANSPAAKAGLVPGMVITKLNGERPDDQAGFENSFEKFDGIVKLSCESANQSAARDLNFDLRTHFIAAK